MGIFEFLAEYLKRKKGEQPKDVTEELTPAPTIQSSFDRANNLAYGTAYGVRDAAVEKGTELAKGRPLTEEEKANTQALMGAADLAGAIVKPDVSVIQNINRYKKYVQKRNAQKENQKKLNNEVKRIVNGKTVSNYTPPSEYDIQKKATIDTKREVEAMNAVSPLDNPNQIARVRNKYLENKNKNIPLLELEAEYFEGAKNEWVKKVAGVDNKFDLYPDYIKKKVESFWTSEKGGELHPKYTLEEVQTSNRLAAKRVNNIRRSNVIRGDQYEKVNERDALPFRFYYDSLPSLNLPLDKTNIIQPEVRSLRGTPLWSTQNKDTLRYLTEGSYPERHRTPVLQAGETSPIFEGMNRVIQAEDIINSHTGGDIGDFVGKRIRAGEQAKYNARAIAADKRYKEQQAKKAAKNKAEWEKMREDYPLLKGETVQPHEVATWRDYQTIDTGAAAPVDQVKREVAKIKYLNPILDLEEGKKEYYSNIRKKTKEMIDLEWKNVNKSPYDKKHPSLLTPDELAVEQYHMENYARKLAAGKQPKMPQQFKRPAYEYKPTYKEWLATKGGISPSERKLFRGKSPIMSPTQLMQETIPREEVIADFRETARKRLKKTKESVDSLSKQIKKLKEEGKDGDQIASLQRYEEALKEDYAEYLAWKKAARDLAKTRMLNTRDPAYRGAVAIDTNFDVAPTGGKVFKPLSQPLTKNRTVDSTLEEFRIKNEDPMGTGNMEKEYNRRRLADRYRFSGVPKTDKEEVMTAERTVESWKEEVKRLKNMSPTEIFDEYENKRAWEMALAEAEAGVKYTQERANEIMDNVAKWVTKKASKGIEVNRSEMSPEQIFKLSGAYARKLNKAKKGGK